RGHGDRHARCDYNPRPHHAELSRLRRAGLAWYAPDHRNCALLRASQRLRRAQTAVGRGIVGGLAFWGNVCDHHRTL
ncbi:hypothetical protein LTR81_028073, partial [Elasticomyces elasticus]